MIRRVLLPILIVSLVRGGQDMQSQYDQGLSFQILEPRFIAELYSMHSIDYTVANFGAIPYDSSLQGSVAEASPLDACSEVLKSDSPIMMVQRGNCTFTQKAHNVQLAGAKMMVIMDNVQEKESELELTGDGVNQEVSIPSIMLSLYDSQQLVHNLQMAKEKDQKHGLVIKVDFPRMKQQKNSQVELWMLSSDLRSIQTALRLLSSYDQSFKQDNQVELSLHYATHVCYYCKAVAFRTSNQDCTNGGRYCAPDPDFMGPLTGRDVVLENLKQKCLYQHDHAQFLAYIQRYSKECFQSNVWVKDYKECITKIDKEMGINVDSCVYSGFQDKTDLNAGDNTVLRQERELLDQRQLHSYPQVLINGIRYKVITILQPKGNLGGQALSNAICESFEVDSRPEHCVSKSGVVMYVGSHAAEIALMLTVALLAMIVFLFFYRRSMKREVQKELQLQVNSAISQYYALNDKPGQQVEVKTVG